MKIVTSIVASLVTVLLSFGAFAAKEIQKEDVMKMKLTKVGNISTSEGSAPMDAKRELSQKADEAGGMYYLIISADKNGANIRTTAEVYK